MGLIYSKCYFKALRILSIHIRFKVDFNQMTLEFKNRSINRLEDLKSIYKHGEMNKNFGRKLAFLRFMEELQLTEREWGEMFTMIYN